MEQFGEKVWFCKIGEGGVSTFGSRMTQGIYGGHHDRTRAVLCVAPELKLTNKVIADKEGAGPSLPRIVVERTLEA